MDVTTRFLLEQALSDDPKEFKSRLDELQQIFNYQKRLINQLREKIERLESEHYKDDEICRLESRLSQIQADMNRGFPISHEEQSAILAWSDKHLREKHWDTENVCPRYAGCAGGRFVYKFIPTSLGVLGLIECDCGEHFVFQDMV